MDGTWMLLTYTDVREFKTPVYGLFMKLRGLQWLTMANTRKLHAFCVFHKIIHSETILFVLMYRVGQRFLLISPDLKEKV